MIGEVHNQCFLLDCLVFSLTLQTSVAKFQRLWQISILNSSQVTFQKKSSQVVQKCFSTIGFISDMNAYARPVNEPGPA